MDGLMELHGVKYVDVGGLMLYPYRITSSGRPRGYKRLIENDGRTRNLEMRVRQRRRHGSYVLSRFRRLLCVEEVQ